MAGPNLARGAQLRAAKKIGFSPTELNLPGMGGVAWEGQTPTVTVDPAVLQGQQLLQQLLGVSGAGAGALQPGLEQYGQRALGAAGGLFDQLQSFDPLTAAENRYAQLSQILAPEQARQMEQRQASLLQQGRLGGTEGARLESELAAAQQAQRYGLLDRLYGEAEQSQRNMLADALAAGGAGASVYGGMLGSVPQLLGAYQQSSAPLANLLGLSSNLGSAFTQAQIAKSGALGSYNQTMAAAPSSGGLLSGLATGALGAAGTAFGGPVGGALGSWTGNLFGGGGGGGANTLSPQQGMAGMFG